MRTDSDLDVWRQVAALLDDIDPANLGPVLDQAFKILNARRTRQYARRVAS